MTMQVVIGVLRSQQYDASPADCTALNANMQLGCYSHMQKGQGQGQVSIFYFNYYALSIEGHKDMCSNTLGHLGMFPVVIVRVCKPFKCLRVCSCFSALKRQKGRCACIISAFQECLEL